MLLLDANNVVSTDRLTAGLWEDDPPETAQKALQVHVSGLRKVLGKERVVTREPGYLLRVEADELDLARFERLREQGKPADALALWRGHRCLSSATALRPLGHRPARGRRGSHVSRTASSRTCTAGRHARADG